MLKSRSCFIQPDSVPSESDLSYFSVRNWQNDTEVATGMWGCRRNNGCSGHIPVSSQGTMWILGLIFTSLADSRFSETGVMHHFILKNKVKAPILWWVPVSNQNPSLSVKNTKVQRGQKLLSKSSCTLHDCRLPGLSVTFTHRKNWSKY